MKTRPTRSEDAGTAVASYASLARELASATTARQAQAIADRCAGAVAPPTPAARSAPSQVEPDKIGIWQRTVIDGETWYVRGERHAFNRLWADVDRIGPKRQGQRVVLLGESCARGWPLDPLFNCATALRTYLARVPGGEDVEIVDLARCSIEAEPMRHLLEAARALDPDLWIIFAGNNWVVDPSRLDSRVLGTTIATTGRWRDIAPHVDAVVRTQIAEWMRGLGDAVQRTGKPAMFVIPAENVRDRWLPTDLYNPLSGSADQERRRQCLETIQRHADAGDWAAVESNAAELVALEDGCSISGLCWLGRAALARQAPDEAIRFFARARELTVHLLMFGLNSYVTRCDEIRARAADHGFHVVDLSRDLMDIGEDRPPGRHTFLDGCHMTGDGIVRAMAATATRLLPLLDLPGRSLDELLRVPIPIEPRAEAQAHFIAAQLNWHDGELAGYHYARAAECTSEIVDVMLRYLDLRLREVPLKLCDAVSHLSSQLARFPGIDAMGIWLHADRHADLMTLTTRTMTRARPDAVSECLALSDRAVRTDAGAINLLAYASQGDFTRFLQEQAYLTCVRNVMQFRVLAGALPRRCRLSLTTRGREPGSIGKMASLFVDGALVQMWPVTATWSRSDWVVDLAPPSDGVHLLELVWPDPDVQREDRVRSIAQAFEDWATIGEMPVFTYVFRLCTVWGEVHSFTATPLGSSRGATPCRD